MQILDGAPAKADLALERLAGRLTALWRRRANERKLVIRLVNNLQHRLQDATGVGGATESQFLDFGRIVTELAQAGDRLVEKSRLVVEIALGRAGGDQALTEIVELLRQAACAEVANQDLTKHLIADLALSGSRMEEVRSIESGLARAMGVMRVVGVMFRTESARLPDDIRGLFLDLAAHIVSLETQVRDSFGTHFLAVEETRATLARAITDIERDAAERSSKADKTRLALEQSLDTMTAQIASNRSREVDLMGLSRRLSSEAGRIVMGLQTHDIITQKLSHVGQALSRILIKASDPVAAQQGDLLREFHEFCKIEAGQLWGVGHDLRSAFESIEVAAKSIQKQVNAVDDADGLLSQFADATSTSAEMVQVLLDAFADLRSMVGESASAGKAARRTVEPIVCALSGLNAAMTEVAVKLGLVALNAQVLAVQRGQGTGLEVLAARAAQIAKDAQSFGDRVSRAATDVAGRIAGIAEGFEEAEAKMEQEASRLDSEGSVYEQRLHGMRDEMLVGLQELGAAVDDIRTVMGRLSGHSDALSQPLAHLESARMALEEAGEAALQTAGRDLTGIPDSEWDEWLQNRYTMDSERRVHEAVVDGGGAAPSSATPAAGDVELF